MEKNDSTAIDEVGPSGLTSSQGFLLAALLSLAFLGSTAYTSVVTLMDRIQSTDVMKAVSSDIWSAKIAGQVLYFCVAQVLLHLAMGVLAWLLGLAVITQSPTLRPKLGRIIAGWFALLGAATIAYNALWYPRTFFGAHYYDYMIASAGPLHIGQWIYGSVSVLAVAAIARATGTLFRRLPASRRRQWAALAATLAGLWILAAWAQHALTAARAQSHGERPHIILLGLDSLRLDQLRRFGGTAGNLPHVDRFIADADVVKDVSTPMARTFGSWVAILTGRSPTVTNGRNNLTPRDAVAVNPTIADVLRKAGYRTIYSTDEVRFANIDQSYGFDEVVTPPIGASDFILGTYNELPLASVVINTRIGQWLFPFSYGNRGAAQVFDPKTYLGRLDRDLKFDRPTFLVVHLTAAHWPYYTAETPFGVSTKHSPEDRPMYRIGLRTADSMFGQVVSMLKRKGALNNAIVVALSDHGEAMLLPNDAIVKHGAFVEGLGAPLKVLDTGHGQSVLSQTQYKVLLGFRSFGAGAGFKPLGRDLPTVATVEDIAPTLLDLVGLSPDALRSNGRSLAPLLRSPGLAFPDALVERVRFTETDLAVLPNTAGDVDEVETARENSKFFVIDPSSARMHIRHRMLPLAHAYKERAAFTSKHLLAAMPAGPYAHQYVYFDIASGNGRLLLERPGGDLPEGALLWDALNEHFRGELRRPVRVSLADWPIIQRQWERYFIDSGDRSDEAGVRPPLAVTSQVSTTGRDGAN